MKAKWQNKKLIFSENIIKMKWVYDYNELRNINLIQKENEFSFLDICCCLLINSFNFVQFSKIEYVYSASPVNVSWFKDV